MVLVPCMPSDGRDDGADDEDDDDTVRYEDTV